MAAMETSDAASADEEIELEWEEWDGKSPFLHHCIAGSIAGVAEHTLLYPVDTVKTHMMSYCADCPVPNQKAGYGTNPTAAIHSCARSSKAKPEGLGLAAASHGPQHGMLTTMRNLVNHGHSSSLRLAHGRQAASLASAGAVAAKEAAAAAAVARSTQTGVLRLWRGVQTMMVGCVPAHALYFSSYEAIKSAFLARAASDSGAGGGPQPENLGPVGSAVAGASAAFCHDLIITPLDTVKQRMQLGHYRSMSDAIGKIVANEGTVGLYRSFPITLLTNLPYGMVMVSTNEFLRDALKSDRAGSHLDIRTTMLAGCGAGMVAAAATTPLDRLKTRLQTQRLGTAIAMQAATSCDGAPMTGGCPKARAEMALLSGELRPRYAGLSDAFLSVAREEGYAGLFRGMTPRLLTHTPAVAISWTAYEAAKRWLATNMS